MFFPAIQYFRENAHITKTANRLPHWQQEGACYFITFHLADSLPESILSAWRAERTAWFQVHPEPWSQAEELEYHQRFSKVRERWLDAGHGSCCLRGGTASLVQHSLQYFDGERYLLHAFVVMPNHVHLLVSLLPGECLEKVVRSWKSFTSRQIHGGQKRCDALWQKDYFDRMIRDLEHFVNVAWYIKRNPEKAHVPAAPLYMADWLQELLARW